MPRFFPFHYPPETEQFFIRPITPADRSMMAHAFEELSVNSRYLRFFQSLARLSDYQLEYLTAPDGHTHVAWGIMDVSGKEDKGVGAMRFIRLKDRPEVAETAITIIDRYQRRGLSYVAFCVLNLLAKEAGVTTFRHHVLHANTFVIDTLDVLGITGRSIEGGVHIIETAVIPNHLAIPDRPELQRLREMMALVEERMMVK